MGFVVVVLEAVPKQVANGIVRAANERLKGVGLPEVSWEYGGNIVVIRVACGMEVFPHVQAVVKNVIPRTITWPAMPFEAFTQDDAEELVQQIGEETDQGNNVVDLAHWKERRDAKR
jgi:hypothetical protein